jgi:hypothetical protein
MRASSIGANSTRLGASAALCGDFSIAFALDIVLRTSRRAAGFVRREVDFFRVFAGRSLCGQVVEREVFPFYRADVPFLQQRADLCEELLADAGTRQHSA